VKIIEIFSGKIFEFLARSLAGIYLNGFLGIQDLKINSQHNLLRSDGNK